MNAPFHFEGNAAALKPPGDEPWAWWQAAATGTFGPVSDTAPQTGFYRYRQRASDRGLPCAIWHDEADGWLCLIDNRTFRDVGHAWAFSHKHPITETGYHRAIEGEPWPDEVAKAAELEAPPTAGHNAALPEEVALDGVRQADEAFMALLKAWGGTVTNEEQDTATAGYKDRIARLRKDAEAARVAEKEPHLKASREVDAKWKPVATAAEAAEKRISDAATAYRVERKRLADIAEAEERAARDALKAQHSTAAAAAVTAGAAPPPSPLPMAPRTPRRATGLREVKETEIVDLPATVAWILAMSPVPTDFLEAVKKVADRRFAFGEVPGAKRVTSYKA